MDDRSAILWAKGLSANAIHSEMRLDFRRVLRDHEYMFDVRNLLTVEKMLLLIFRITISDAERIICSFRNVPSSLIDCNFIIRLLYRDVY